MAKNMENNVEKWRQALTLLFFWQGDGSTFLQLGASIKQQINGMFKMMEEYNWDSFVVVTSMYPGYDTYVDYIRSFIDTSYFLWELQDILTFDMSADGMNDLRARRLLQQIDAQVLLVYCSHDEAQYLFSMARDVGLVGPGYIWLIPSLAVGNPNMPPPDSFPIGLISIITDRWKMSLRNRVRDGVAIVVKAVESFRKQRGFIPDGHMDCQSPERPSTNDTLYRWVLTIILLVLLVVEILPLKWYFTQKLKFCHHELNLMLFQTCMTFFVL